MSPCLSTLSELVAFDYQRNIERIESPVSKSNVILISICLIDFSHSLPLLRFVLMVVVPCQDSFLYL